MRTVLFFRDVRKFQGGHLKVWDYFTHVRESGDFTPKIAFTPQSRWDEENPWHNATEYVVEAWQQLRPDVFFVAGRDWLMLDQHPLAAAGTPVIHLVQDFYFADKDNFRYQYLSRRAIRICVSDEVAAALHETGRVAGPLLVIPNGVNLGELPATRGLPRTTDVLIVSVKRPDLGQQLRADLARPDRHIDVLSHRVPRPELLRRLAQARVTVFLPKATEGFYLPALEGMAMGTLVVCPDCVGNRTFCQDGYNGFRPAYVHEALLQATDAALAMPSPRVDTMVANAMRTAERHSLERERHAFLDLLRNIEQAW